MSSSKEFKRRRFEWLDQVIGKAEYPASAFKVAYRIAQKCNEEREGAAWESCKTIGEAIGLSESTVITLVRRLQKGGDLNVEWGRQGRGHSNRYWMLLKPQSTKVFKPQPAKVLEPKENLGSRRENLENAPGKPWPAKEISSKNSIKNSNAGGGSRTHPDGVRSPPPSKADIRKRQEEEQRQAAQEEKRLAEERKNRETIDELKKKYGPNYGLKSM